MSRSRRVALAAVAAAGAAGLAAATWGIAIERYLFILRRHELAILPPGSPEIRILHISDAHMAPWQRRKQAWIAELARFEPHLVVNTGDNLGHADGLEGVRRAYAPLQGIPGFFVYGSNDVDAPTARNPFRYLWGPSKGKHRGTERLDTAALDDYLTDDLGWIDLNNAVGTTEVAGLSINGFGVADAHRDWDDLDVLPDLVERLPSADLTLGVTHAPYRRVLDEFTALGADAIFAGHTHGGQVRIPGSPAALVANCDIPLDQARGLSEWHASGRMVPLNVSAGLGHSIYAPIRFACRPEATLLTLVPQPFLHR